MQIYFRHNKFRKGQKEVITDVSQAIEERKNLLLHAPTGTGKTDSALSVALKHAIDNNLKVLFLTPKISQHKIALEVVKDINEKYNTNIKAIDFVGKKHMCIDPVTSKTGVEFYEVCNKQIKKKTCMFYNNIKPQEKMKKEFALQRVIEYLKESSVLSHHQVISLAEEYTGYNNQQQPVCAYELAKIFAKDCRLIIGDYYHLFSENVSNVLSDINVSLSDCIVIIDEAHNLQERLIKLVSKKISTFVLHRCIEEAKAMSNSGLTNVIKNFMNNLENLAEKKLINSYEEEIKKEELLIPDINNHLFEVISEIEETGLKYIEKNDLHKSALISLALFLEDWVVDKKEKVRYVAKEKGLIYACHNAVDVSKITKPVFEKVYSSILMSATLTPLDMYRELYGLDKKDCLLKEHFCPFDKERRLNLLVTTSSTKYTSRSEKEYMQIAKTVTTAINSVEGNIVVFFPSFEILKQVTQNITTMKETLTQEEYQSTKEFEKMIDLFKKHSKNYGAVLYAVMGGKASEGIDLPGDFLKCAVIVGIPLSKMNIEVKYKIEYYDQKYSNGWLYAYIQPAMQKVIQSAGRVIRSDTDRGVVIFVDKRYLWNNYRKCFPKDLRLRISKDLQKEITDFFIEN